MKSSLFRHVVHGGLVACCLVASLSTEAVVVGRRVLDEDPDGNVVNALMNSFRFHADGLSARFIDQANQGIDPATETSWRAFAQRMTGSTFVTLFYTYQGSDGVPRSRTYYAMSGSRGTVDSGPEALLTADLPTWLDPWPGEVLATVQDDTRTRIPWEMPTIRPDAPWDLQDAQLKVVRTLERDINDHAVETGGLATVFVSGPSCLACDQALNNFANAYELSLVANETSTSGARPIQRFRAMQAAYLATVRSSLMGRERFRPADAPPVRGDSPIMCVPGRPVVAYPLARRPSTPSAVTSLIRAYARLDGDASYVLSGSDASYATWSLVDPSSPYSALADRDLSPVNDADRLAAQLLVVAGRIPSQHEITQRKQRELGFTRSRPWIDVDDVFGPPTNASRGGPSQSKAGVEPAVATSVRTMVGENYPAVGALYAVAAQLLREKLAITPGIDRRRLAWRADVVSGMNDGTWRPTDFDRQYLAVLLDGAMREWQVEGGEGNTRPSLPVPLRVARMAAAYRDQQPYDVDPCLRSGEHDPATAGRGGDDPRPLCFNDATDRAVYAWFVAELRHETASRRPTEVGDPHRERMTGPFRYTQFGDSPLGAGSLAAAIRKEVVEMHVVNRLVADGDLTHEASLPVIRRAVTLLQPARN